MKLSKLAMALAAGGLLTAGSANAYLLNWALDTNGAAAGGVVAVQELIDLTGTSYIKSTFSGGTPPAIGDSFTFNEAGLFSALTADGGVDAGGANLPSSLSASFTGTGTGIVGTGFTFNTDGQLIVRNSASVAIGKFQLVSGEGALLNTSLVPNGALSLVFRATEIEAGYFFRDISLTDDLYDNVSDGLFFGFVSVNASKRANGFISPTVSTLYNNTFSDTAAGNDQVQNLWIGNNGQFRLQVPEPGSLALLGLGLAGLGVLRRRHQKKA